MSTQDIFGAFETAPLPTVGGPANGAATEPAPPVRKTRGPRKTAPAALPAAGGPAKRRGRPPAMEGVAPRVAKRPAVRRTAPASRTATPEPSPTGKLDLNTILLAGVGLSADEARMMVAAVTSLQKISKKSRAKIVTALGKIFA